MAELNGSAQPGFLDGRMPTLSRNQVLGSFVALVGGIGSGVALRSPDRAEAFATTPSLHISVTQDTAEFGGVNKFLTVTNTGECVTEDTIFYSQADPSHPLVFFGATLQPGEVNQNSIPPEFNGDPVGVHIYACSDVNEQGPQLMPEFRFPFGIGEWDDPAAPPPPPPTETAPPITQPAPPEPVPTTSTPTQTQPTPVQPQAECIVPAVLKKKPETVKQAQAQIRKDPDCRVGSAVGPDNYPKLSAAQKRSHMQWTLAGYALKNNTGIHRQKAGAHLPKGAVLHPSMRAVKITRK